MMKKKLKKLTTRALNLATGGRLSEVVGGDQSLSLIEKASRFVSCEIVAGDYLEFGVYQGNSFSRAYNALSVAFKKRIQQSAGGATEEQQAERSEIWNKMRFFAFDSYEGLPELEGVDSETKDFRKGQYAAGEELFLKNVCAAGVPAERVIPIKGWFKDTVNEETFQKHKITKASIIWIDGDLYESAISVLSGITPLLQDGTILIFDDWFAFRGNPNLGEQRAFKEWKETVKGFDFVEYQKEGTWRNSFIACKSGVS